MEYVRVVETLNHPIGTVWGIVQGFGAVKAWIAGVEACSLEGEGVGAIRSVTRGGSVTRERLEFIDAASHSLSYVLLPPYRLAATDVRGNIALMRVDDQQTTMTWWSEASSFEADQNEIAKYIDGFYRASIDNLRRILDAPPST
jgi:hypothetical protein